MSLPRIVHKRRAVQAVLIVVAVLIPFVSISGNPFLRMDIGQRTLYLAAVPVRVDQFYLVLLATLAAVALFLLITALLGRVWCGWLCPQTVFNDIGEMAGNRVRASRFPGAALLAEHLAAAMIAVLTTMVLFCWFVPPRQLMTSLMQFTSHPLFAACFFVLTLCGYLNLVLVKRGFCRSYCPYGRFQAALMDDATLNLTFHDEVRDRCLRCGACVRGCPMEIDIRDGFQIECIGCGRCIDACRGVMEKRPGGTGLIGYRFGPVKGTGVRIGSKSTVLALLTMMLILLLAWGLSGRTQSSFALQRVATAETRLLPDGSRAYSWRAVIGNRSQDPMLYDIRISNHPETGIALLGPVTGIQVAPNQNREVIFMLHVMSPERFTGGVILSLCSGGSEISSVTIRP